MVAEKDIGHVTGTVEAFPAFERKTELLVSPSMSEINDQQSHVQITNYLDHTITIPQHTTVAVFRILTPNQAKNVQPMTNEQLTLISKFPDEANNVINQLFQEADANKDKRWNPTPDTCDDPDKLNRIERRIFDEIIQLREAEKLDPTRDDDQRRAFLKNFTWDDSIFTEQEQQRIEALLVKYHTIFARHRLDIGINTDFKIKLTPKHDDLVYAQSLPTPTILKDDLLVELALMQEYGIITTLPYSKYSSPIFAQRKPNGKLRILVDLRRINYLLKNDYNQHNHPVTTIADAAQNMAGKKYFCKLDCSQAYHCLQMADEQSIQLLAFNFGSRTFAYLRLAQGLNRSLSAFNSTIREYLDALVKADKCAQYVDDIGVAAHNVDELAANIEAVFQQIQKAGLKLSMSKCAFGHTKIEFLGRSITTKGIAPLADRIDDFLKKLKLPTSVKSLQRYIGFVQFYRQYIPKLAEKLVPLYKLLQKDVKFAMMQVHKDAIFDINENLARAAKLSLRLPLPDKQLVIMCDASEHAAGYVLLIEDYTESNGDKKKTYAPVVFGSQRFTEGQMSLTMYAKEFLAMHFAFDEFAHILWGVKKPTIVMTDNKALTRFFQSKRIPPKLWNHCDQALQFDFVLAHVPGVENPAADYLSRLDINPEDRIHLKLNDQIPVYYIEIDLAAKTPKQDDDEEDYDPDQPQHNTPADTPEQNKPDTTNTHDALSQMQSLLHSLANTQDQPDDDRTRMIQIISRHLEPVLTDGTPSIMLTMFTRKQHTNTVNQVCPQGDPQIIQAQLSNQDVQKMIRVLVNDEPLPNHVNFASTFFQKLVKNRKRLEVVNKALYRKFFDNTGRVLKAKPVNPKRLIPPLEKIYDPCNGPEDILEIDLVGELPCSNGYTHILMACDYFSRYLFATPIRKPHTKSVVNALLQIITRHAYVPKTIITDKGTAFTSSIITELMKTAGFQIEHATVKHAETIGMVERSHQKLKQILKINVAADSPQWDKYVNLAVMAHNTTYHQSLKCTPSEVFHGRVPFNALDLKFSNPLQSRTQDTDLTKLVDQVNEKYKQVNDNILQAYHKYKRYYDRKAQASPLKGNDFVFLLNPKITDQSDKIAFNHFKWEGPFKVVKVLTNFNYIVRKIGTSRTQCVHRMRLRPFIPNAPIHDIEEDPNLFYADPEAFDDQDLFNDHVPQTIHFERTPALPPPEELDTEHGIIYYDQAQRSPPDKWHNLYLKTLPKHLCHRLTTLLSVFT